MPSIVSPAVTEVGYPVIVRWSKVAGVTLKGLLVPACVAPNVLIVMPVPVVVILTGSVRTPLMNGPVFIGLIVPVESASVFDPV